MSYSKTKLRKLKFQNIKTTKYIYLGCCLDSSATISVFHTCIVNYCEINLRNHAHIKYMEHPCLFYNRYKHYVAKIQLNIGFIVILK